MDGGKGLAILTVAVALVIKLLFASMLFYWWKNGKKKGRF